MNRSGLPRGRKSSDQYSPRDDCDSDLRSVHFHSKASDGTQPDDLKVADSNSHPRHSLTRVQKLQSSPVTFVDSGSSSESEQTPRKRPTRSKKSKSQVVASDESESPQPRKRRRLVKGMRPATTPPTAETDVEDLLEEVDEDVILDSRLRDRTKKKSAFAHNLERLQRRRRGHMSISRSEEEVVTDDSESSPHECSVNLEPVGGVGATNIESDEEGLLEDVATDQDDSDFIVKDDDEGTIPELPTMFSMGTFQDLSHHFKVICQLFVHLAVKEPHKRRPFMKEVTKKNYFSVPLAITRRKLAGMRDSLVTSSIWKPEFMHPLQTFPIFRLEPLDFTTPLCDACHLTNRIATLRGIVSGNEYDSLIYESPSFVKETEEEEASVVEWNLGRFCAARAQVFHSFTHWEHNLYHTLRIEVDCLQKAIQLNDEERTEKRVFVPATKGPPPPDDLEDADGVMDWLDGRGIINTEWVKMKAMMERAHTLDARGKGVEDDIELG